MRILYVGDAGTGVLDVSGGFVTNSSGYLGWGVGSVGTATVSSGTWNNRGPLYVGGALGGTGGTEGPVIVGGTLSKGTFGAINLDAGGTLQIGTGTMASGVLGTDLVNNGTLIFNRLGSGTAATSISGTGG